MASTMTPNGKNNSALIGFDAKLWLAADKLRNNVDAVEYMAHAGAVHSQTESNQRQSRTFAALRDTLLPTLLRGELNVAEFELKAGNP